jgi:UDP-arabinose 4-epimerase
MSGKGSVLITGGAGYIGSHAAKALAAKGYLPVAYDNLTTGNIDAVKWGPLVVGDVRNKADLAAAMASHKPQVVMHFAASAYVGESVADPAKYYGNNLVGMQALLEAMREGGIGKLVFSSSCATYGIPDILPITEKSPQNPINPYGRTKLVCEMMISDFAAAYGLDHVILRYFNVAGADPDGELVERHDPETHLIPRVLMAALGAIEAIEVLGDDYPTPDGTCIRDYIHVTDVVEGHAHALDRLVGGGPSAKFNLGIGRGFSVREILEAASRQTGRSIGVRISPRRPGDPPELIADAGLAKAELGFSPRYSDLGTIIATAFRSAETVHGQGRGPRR